MTGIFNKQTLSLISHYNAEYFSGNLNILVNMFISYTGSKIIR